MPTKTIVKKVSAKKATTTKKVAGAKKTKSHKVMVCAQSGECFWTSDGLILQNLRDLHRAFGSMNYEVFLNHVQKEKNDFADWVEHILHDLDCAVALRKTTQMKQSEKVVATHLKKYSN